jgi:hypothetical protein
VARKVQAPLREVGPSVVRMHTWEVPLAKGSRENRTNIYVLVRCLSDDELHEVEQLRSPGRVSSMDDDFVDLPINAFLYVDISTDCERITYVAAMVPALVSLSLITTAFRISGGGGPACRRWTRN